MNLLPQHNPLSLKIPKNNFFILGQTDNDFLPGKINNILDPPVMSTEAKPNLTLQKIPARNRLIPGPNQTKISLLNQNFFDDILTGLKFWDGKNFPLILTQIRNSINDYFSAISRRDQKFQIWVTSPDPVVMIPLENIHTKTSLSTPNSNRLVPGTTGQKLRLFYQVDLGDEVLMADQSSQKLEIFRIEILVILLTPNFYRQICRPGN